MHKNRARVIGLVAGVGLALAAGGGNASAAQRPEVYAITGATVITAPGSKSLENATVVLRDGLIEAVGSDISVPADAEIIDGSGLTAWAGWIDAFSTLALKEEERPQAGGGRGGGIQAFLQQSARAEETPTGTGHPIARVHPQYTVTDDLVANDTKVGKHREAGFTAALVVPRDGIYKGRSALIALRDGTPRQMVVKADVAQEIAFGSRGFGRSYPGSLMGVISTIRQVLLDAQRAATWEESYARNPAGIPRPETDDAYPPLQPVLSGDEPVIFEATNNRMTERALRIAQEFSLRPIIKGNGNEYEITDMLAEAQVPLIVPVDYPSKPKVDDADAALDVTLQTLERWDRAASNAAALEQAGIRFAFTADGVNNPADFVKNVRKAIEEGLSEQTALAAVTVVPAQIFGVDAILGTVEKGKIANLVVATGRPFAEDTEIRHVFVDGYHTEIEAKEPAGNPDAVVDPRGTWDVTMGGGQFSQQLTWTIEGEPGAYRGSSTSARGTNDFSSVELNGNALTVGLSTPRGTLEVTVVIEGDNLSGSVDTPQGFSLEITGKRTSGPGARAGVDQGGLQ
ncbi:MAG: amidohydrolase family protein [Acidobacteriota bacterium]